MKKVIVLGSLNMDLTIQCVDLPKTVKPSTDPISL